ncbi:MAG: thioesterase family protein [Minwuiales bacterium]|nr:thioesterase family protein [Minwuiales bacterium]
MTYDAPLIVHREAVQPAWIDYNGHMNVAYYNLAFDHSVDALFNLIDVGIDYVRRTNMSVFVLETHVNYIQEVVEGDPLRFELQLIDWDAKRAHFFIRMFHDEKNYLAATSEQLSVHVDLSTRRTAPLPDAAQQALARMMESHSRMARPAEVGRAMGIRRKPEAAE